MLGLVMETCRMFRQIQGMLRLIMQTLGVFWLVMDPRVVWNHSLHLADEWSVDVDAERRNIDHLIDGMVRPVLDPLDVGLHLTQNRVKGAIAEALDKGLHKAGDVWLHSMDWVVVRALVLQCILNRMYRLVINP